MQIDWKSSLLVEVTPRQMLQRLAMRNANNFNSLAIEAPRKLKA
jgi:hypothetical protein